MGNFLFAQGGLGILSLEAQNACVLNKWIYKLINQTLFDKNLARKKCLKKIYWACSMETRKPSSIIVFIQSQWQ